MPATRIDIGELNLHVVEEGEGEPLLLVHGFPLDHQMWHGQIEELKDRFRVLAPDLRGFGRSDVTGGATSMWQFADDLAALLDAMGVDTPVTLCGLSMGGYVAWQFLRRHRERLARLILCDTRATADSPEAVAVRLETADRVEAEGPAFLGTAMVEKLFAPETIRSFPEVIQSIRQTIASAPDLGVAAASRGMAERESAVDWLDDIDVPTLILCGEHDAISPPEEMQGIAERIPQARFEIVPDGGHMSPLENPAFVNQAIREFMA